MKKTIQKLKYTLASFALVFGFSLVFLAPSASASLFSGAKKEACAGTQLTKKSGPNCAKDDSESLSRTIQRGIDFISIVVGVIAVLMIIIGGLRYIISDGDSGKITTARNTIMYALIGLILVAFAQIIVKFVITKV